jgi:hypothetical protein
MLFIKIMSAQDLPDSHPSKNFHLITIGDRDRVQVGYCDAKRDDLSESDKKMIFILRDGEPGFDMYERTGNTYIMNHNGKTIASHDLIDE